MACIRAVGKSEGESVGLKIHDTSFLRTVREQKCTYNFMCLALTSWGFALTQNPFNGTNFINAWLTQHIFSVWPMAQPVVGEMEMHSVANLATVQTALATFFPFKKAPKPYLVSENCQYCPARSCFPFLTRTHLSPSLCSVSVQRMHTHLSLSISLSLHLLSFCSAHAHTSLSLSLSLHLLSFCSAHAHTSLSLSLNLLSFCSARAHTSLSLFTSSQFMFSTRQRRAELNSVKYRY